MRLPTDRQIEAYHHVKVMHQTYTIAGAEMGISRQAVSRLMQRLRQTVRKIPNVCENQILRAIAVKAHNTQTVDKRSYI